MPAAVEPQDEQPRELREGESEAVTLAFSDAEAGICGVARVGRALTGGELRTSGLALLFAGGEPVAIKAEPGTPVPGSEVWGEVQVAGVESEVLDPLERWSVTFDSGEGHGFDLEVEATSKPARLEAGMPAGRVGGMEGYDQLVTVRGSVTVGGSDRRFEGRGQRGHSWGAPDWAKLKSARTIGVWLEGDGGVAVTAVRPLKAGSHADEAIHSVLLGEMPTGATSEGDDRGSSDGMIVADPRISTTYDDDGHQRSAGLELYTRDDDALALRIAGEVACGTTLDLGTLELKCAFFVWRMDGRSGVGRYDLLTNTGA